MARDADGPKRPLAHGDEPGGRLRELDRRALLLGAAAAGAGVATLAAGAGTADALPVQYVRLASESLAATTTWIQTTAGIGFLGVQDNPSGLLASTSLVAGVAGDSDAVDGVLGVSSAANGVHGISSANGASGVLGDDTSATGGYGVQGESANGVGVLASSANGTALKVEGPAQLTGSLSAGGQITAASLATAGAVAAGSLTATGAVAAAALTATGAVSAGSLTTTGAAAAETLAVTGKLELGRSGAAIIPAHRKTVRVPVPGMTRASLVIATSQGTSVRVAVACVAAKEGYFVIHMNRAPRRNMRVAWLVLN
jgi:hypothetical protein